MLPATIETTETIPQPIPQKSTYRICVGCTEAGNYLQGVEHESHGQEGRIATVCPLQHREEALIQPRQRYNRCQSEVDEPPQRQKHRHLQHFLPSNVRSAFDDRSIVWHQRSGKNSRNSSAWISCPCCVTVMQAHCTKHPHRLY